MPKTQKAKEKPEVGIIIEEKAKKPAVFREVYPIQEPYVYAAIVKDPETQKTRYEVIEPTLQKEDENLLKEIKSLLMEEIDVNLKEIETKEKAEKYLREKAAQIIKKYHIKVPPESVDKLLYYIMRDFIGYGKIDPLMKDHLIEDISADGVNIPIYVWHRVYESIPTNIIFKDEAELNSFIIRLGIFGWEKHFHSLSNFGRLPSRWQPHTTDLWKRDNPQRLNIHHPTLPRRPANHLGPNSLQHAFIRHGCLPMVHYRE
jgi:type I site-specific restriction-modification system R (restriction) subunit